ncbi:MAG: exo-alpha-sialidase [Clostridia bacterium]|nr:exo-alpha-sialidase [Clostridia bacterium]
MLITKTDQLQPFYAAHRIWQGIPGIAHTKGGRTFLSFYSGGIKETYGNYALVIKSENGKNFGEPIAVAKKDGKYRCFDPVLWIDPLGRLWFIWNVMPGEEIFASICEDPDAEALVWSEEFYIGRGVMMNKPVVLRSGEWLFPIAFWKKDLLRDLRKGAWTPEDTEGSFVYKTSDNGKSFIKLGGADVRNRAFDEHMVVEKENGVLQMLVRLKNGIGESDSYDRGKNWSRGQETQLGGPSSRFFFGKLRSGRVLLINHYQYTGRNNLTALLSEDDGKTFPYRLMLDERHDVSYPDAMEGDDGFVYIVYDRERGAFQSTLQEAYTCAREILTARITEEDIINGSLYTPGSFLKRVASKLDQLAEGDADPYQEPLIEDREFAERLIADGEDPIRRIFEKYPINCINISNFDAKHLDTMITRFRESGGNNPALLTEIIEFIRRTPTQISEPNPVIEQVKKLLEEHLTEDFSVASIADRIKISVYYLSHLFKSVTGTTVVEYRNELRLTKAKLMLLHSEDSVGEIAQRVGFCSAAYFSEVFTKSEKIPPSEYQKLHTSAK